MEIRFFRTVRAAAVCCGVVCMLSACVEQDTLSGPDRALIKRTVEEAIDWPAFMANQDPVWDRAPKRWENGPFLGNGLVGTLISVDPDGSHLKLWLCRSDVGKVDYPGHFRDPMRLQIGTINLHTAGAIDFERSTARLDLWNAEATGVLKTSKGEIEWRCFVPNGGTAIIFETECRGDEAIAWRSDFVEQGATNENADFSVFTVQDKVPHSRTTLAGGGYAVCWKRAPWKDGKERLVVSIGSSPVNRSLWSAEPAKMSAAEEALQSARALLHAEHDPDWWHEYYKRSFVSLPDRALESFYWIQIYKLACTARAGLPMMDNHGIWSVEPVFGFATWDLNVQITYRLHLAANRLEMGQPLVDFLKRSFNRDTMWSDEHGELRAGIKQQTFLRYRFFDPVYWEHKERLPADGPAKFLWGCHNVWLQYRFSQDPEILEPLRDMLVGGVNSILVTMEKDEAGRLNLPNGRSWESKEGRNATGILAVLKWSLEVLSEIEKKLGLSGQGKDWSAIRASVAPYPEDPEIGFLLAENEAPVAHRHWSHLLMIYPLYMLNWDEPADRARIRRSIDTWAELSAGLGDEIPRSGYAPVGAMCLYSSIGDASKTLRCIDKFLYSEHSYWGKTRPSIWANTMYREFGPVMETPLFFAASLQETFLQSWGGTIRVFPAVPAEWDDLVFHNMRAESGFLVSAKRENGKTRWIQITSLAGNPCRLQTDLPLDLERLPNGHYVLPIRKSETLLLSAEGLEERPTVAPVNDPAGQPNSFGLNERFLNPRPYFENYIPSDQKKEEEHAK